MKQFLFSMAYERVLTIVFAFVISTFGNQAAMSQDSNVLVSLSTFHASTSTPITVVESMKMPPEYAATMISHRITRIGIFHRGLDRFVLWNGRVSPGGKMIDLPPAVLGPHGIPMTETAEGRLAVQYKFQAPDPGIYILNVEWSLVARDTAKEQTQTKTGNPVLFFVAPAVDYERQAAQRAGMGEELKLQSYLETQYDRRSSEAGFVMPDFGELAIPNSTN